MQLGTVAVEQGQLSWEDEGYSPALKVRAQGFTIGAQNIQWPQAAGATNAATLKISRFQIITFVTNG